MCYSWLCYVFTMWLVFFFFKQKTAYEMRISDWSSDVCSSDLFHGGDQGQYLALFESRRGQQIGQLRAALGQGAGLVERHHLGGAQLLQGVALAEQDTDLGAAAGAGHGRGRGSQAPGAGAGNDPTGHRVDHGNRKSVGRGKS